MAIIDVYVWPDAAGGGTGVDWTNAYTSLSAAIAAETADLVSDGNEIIFNCRSNGGTLDTTAVDVTGYTTGASNIITLLNAEAHGGAWNTSVYVLQAANQDVLIINEEFVTILGLQIELTSINANYQKCFEVGALASGAVTEVGFCICKSANNASYRERAFHVSPRTMHLYSTLVYNVNTGNTSVANSCIYISSTGAVTNVYNCTFSGGYVNQYDTNGTMNAVDCIFVNAGLRVSANATHWGSSDYNISDYVATTGGANDVNSATFTFVDAANGNFNLAVGDSSGAKNSGTDDPGSGLYSVDLASVTFTSTWSRGCLEYVAAGGRPLPARAFTGPFSGPFGGVI